MGDDKKPADIGQQLQNVRSDLISVRKEIDWMRTRGGFTDAKTHSVRATRIEERLEKLEIQMSAVLDVTAFTASLLEEHLKDRHNADLRSDDHDVEYWRRIRRRLREMAERLGLMDKRRNVTDVRKSENRLRVASA